MSSDPPLASIVIPVWNRADTLGRAIASVLAQTEPDLEVIVVDNGSDDPAAVRAVADAAGDARVRLVRSDVNLGPGGGRNLGAASGRASLLGFLDSDDELDPTWLAKMAAPMVDPMCVVVTSAARRQGAGAAVVLSPKPLGPAFSDVTARFDGPPTFLVRRSLFDSVGGYDEQIWFGENTEIGMRLAAAAVAGGHRLAVVDESLMTWFWDGPGRHGMRRRLDATLRVLEIHHAELRRDRKLFEDYQAVAGVAAARLGDRRLARRCFRGALVTRPSARNVARYLATLTGPTSRRVWGTAG